MDLKRILLHLSSYWHRSSDRVLTLAVPVLPPHWGLTRERAICAHSRRASFLCTSEISTQLSGPRLLLFPRLNDGRRHLGTLFAAASADSLACRSLRRHPEVQALKFGEHTSSEASRVCWSRPRTAFVLFYPQCYRFPLGQEVCRKHAKETLRAAFRASGLGTFFFSEVVRELVHSAKKHGFHRQRKVLCAWYYSRQKALRCQLAGREGLLVNGF